MKLYKIEILKAQYRYIKYIIYLPIYMVWVNTSTTAQTWHSYILPTSACHWLQPCDCTSGHKLRMARARAEYTWTRLFPPGPITYEEAHNIAVCCYCCSCYWVSLHCLSVLRLGQDTSSSPDNLKHNTDFLLWKVSTTNSNGVGANYVSRRALSSLG